MSKYYQHSNLRPHLKNPQKCKSSQVVARSSWEAKLILRYLDINENIIEWNSEDCVIKYLCPTDGKYHRYFIDFWFRAKTKDGSLKEFLVEVKPFSQTNPPSEPKRKTKRFLTEVQTYIKNTAKWDTVKKYCENERKLGRNIEFIIITEKDAPWFLK